MKPSSNRAARAAVSLIRANRNSSNAVAGYCLAAKRSAALNSGATSGSVLDTFVAPLALSQPARTLSTTHHVQKSAMGGIFGRVEEKDDREAQDVAAEPDLSDIPPPPLEFDSGHSGALVVGRTTTNYVE